MNAKKTENKNNATQNNNDQDDLISQSASTQSSSTAIAKQDGGAVIDFDQELLSMYEEESAGGSEDFGKEDKNMPYLVLCQSNTPFVKQASEKYIAGAQEGDIISTFNNKVYKSFKNITMTDTSSLGVLVIPCAYTRGYYEFEIDSEGKIEKFIDEHPIASRLLANCEKQVIGDRKLWIRRDNGHAVIDIAYHYVLVLDEDAQHGCYPCVLKLKGSNHEANKNLNTGISRQVIKLPNNKTIKPAMYHQIWRLYTIGKDDGENSWCIYQPEFHDVVRDPVIAQIAKAFRDEVVSGGAKPIDHTADMDGETPNSDNGASAYESGGASESSNGASSQSNNGGANGSSKSTETASAAAATSGAASKSNDVKLPF